MLGWGCVALVQLGTAGATLSSRTRSGRRAAKNIQVAQK